MRNPSKFFALVFFPVSLSLFAAACSDAQSPTVANAGGATGPTGQAGQAGTTEGGELAIRFASMYSAFDGEHKFVVPATVEGVKKIKWSASDPSMVDLEPSADGSTVNIIMRKAGTVKIVAKAGSLTGEVPLTITKATAQEWEEGSQRYNNGVVIRRGPPGPGAGGPPADGGAPGITKTAACTNCHNSGGGGSDVEHTPMQTGGYSDDDLINIFANGKKPAGVEQRLMPADRWSKIHQWEMSAEEKKGIIVYLRSLTPKSQGALDFGGPRGGGGGGRRDGGAPGGGAGGGTGGGGGNRDGGSVN